MSFELFAYSGDCVAMTSSSGDLGVERHATPRYGSICNKAALLHPVADELLFDGQSNRAQPLPKLLLVLIHFLHQ